MYGFAKSDRDSVDTKELKAFRTLAKEMLYMRAKVLDADLRSGTVTKINDHG